MFADFANSDNKLNSPSIQFILSSRKSISIKNVLHTFITSFSLDWVLDSNCDLTSSVCDWVLKKLTTSLKHMLVLVHLIVPVYRVTILPLPEKHRPSMKRKSRGSVNRKSTATGKRKNREIFPKSWTKCRI